MFSACLSRCEKISQADSGIRIEPTTSWLLDSRHTSAPPRLPDGYTDGSIHTMAPGTALIYQLINFDLKYII